MAKILKFWHQWSWLITIGGYLFLLGMTAGMYKSAIASNEEAIKAVTEQHEKENLDHRVTVLEQIAADNKQNFSDIKDVEKAIFQRINQIVDRHHD